MISDLNEYWREQRNIVETRLGEYLRPQPGIPSTLLDAMRYSLLAPGKRLRPLLALLACEATGGTREQALPAACAVEMVHTYSLIHDDLPAMDNDDLRRGLPTCHKKFDEATAILAGDGLLTLAFQVLAEGYPSATASACCAELARGAGPAGMVGGQVDDLGWEKGGGTVDDLEQLHSRKTGALFRSALLMGAHAARGENPAGPGEGLLRTFDEYGRSFGLLFQITDDLLDVEGSEDQTGKKVQKDAARGKLTYPGFLGISESRRRAEALARRCFDCLVPLGKAAERLQALAHYVVSRDK